MEINAVGAVGAPGAVPERGLSAMNSEDFFRILVAEMQNQDPFEPSDSADIISQVSQIRTIEQSGKLNQTLDLMTNQQRMSGTAGLIGKFVQAITTGVDGSQMLHEGIVTGVRFNADGLAVLELDTGEAVPVADVIRVTSHTEDLQMLSGGDPAADKSGSTQRRRDPGNFGLSFEGALTL